MTAAAIYTRVSSEMQIDGYSLEAQLAACKALAQAKGYTEITEFSDRGKSGRNTKRPQLQAMLTAARAGRFNLLVFHKLDRLGRNARDLFNTFAELEAAGVEICTVHENVDRKTPIGKMTFAMQAAIAEWYSDNLSTETAKGMQARARSGRSGGSIPFGYTAKSKKDGGDGLARPHPTEAAGVVMAFEKYATGNYSSCDIARLLNSAGYRPNGRGSRALGLFTKDTVACLLQNRFYLGEVSYKGATFPGLHEPIISQQLFDRAQAARRSRRSNHSYHANKVRGKTGRIYILAGLAHCARCGGILRAWASNSYQYYRDPAHDRMIDCHQLLIRADRVEAALGDYLRSLELPQDWRERVLHKLHTETGQAAEIRKKHGEISRQLDRLRDLYLLGDMTRGEYISRRDQLTARLNSLQPPELSDIERAAALLGNFGAIWEAAQPVEKKQIVQSLLHAVYLDNDAPGLIVAIEPKPAFIKLFALFTQEEPARPVAPAYNVSIALPGYYAPV